MSQAIGAKLYKQPWWGRLIDRAQRVRFIRRFASCLVAELAVRRTLPRPLPYSCWTAVKDPATTTSGDPSKPYVSWTSLYDRSYTGRHLPPGDTDSSLPPIGTVSDGFKVDDCTLLALYQRKTFRPDPRSTTLFCFFAQWFTDSFLRTDPDDSRRNRSNHEIDLCQIYGPTADATALLRCTSSGLLAHRDLPSGAFPMQLMLDAKRPRPEFLQPIYPGNPKTYAQGILDLFESRADGFPGKPDRRAALHATGLEQGNTTIFYGAINAVVLREHNRIARRLHSRHPKWTKDEVFESARTITIGLLLKLVVEEYITHIAGLPFRIHLDHSFAERRRWYRTNRIAIEFDLLYRWHSLVPDNVHVGGENLGRFDFSYNPLLLEKLGAEQILQALSMQRAGRIGLQNTPGFLLGAEQKTLELSRRHNVRSFREYQKAFNCKMVGSFAELTGETELSGQLSNLYGGDINKLELPVGLLAEKRGPDSVMGKLMLTMVAVDAFSHIYTNPLLSTHIYKHAYNEVGREILEETSSFAEVVRRNAPANVALALEGIGFDTRLLSQASPAPPARERGRPSV